VLAEGAWPASGSKSRAEVRAARAKSHVKSMVSMPLRENHANAPNESASAPAPSAPTGPASGRASRAVSTATAACSSVPSAHAT
jgi:hypothetical protein